MGKVLIIGLDGGTWKILRRLMERGTMPVLQKLVESGTWGTLQSTVPPVTAPAWSTFQTGVNPGKHGIYDFQLFDPLTHQLTLVDASRLKSQTFWEIAAQRGKKVISINVPLTYPPKRLDNWITIGDFLAPKVNANSVHPPELVQELQSFNYRIGIDSLERRHRMTVSEFIKENTEVERTRFRFAKHLLQRTDWDLCMVHNQSMDGIQHAYYDTLMDDAADGSADFASVASFYAASDELLGEMLQEVDSDTTVIVLSDHGFKQIRTKVNINNWLIREGYLKLERKRRLVPALTSWIGRVDVFNLRHRLVARHFRTFTGMKLAARSMAYFVDWKNTRAVMMNGNTFGNVFIRGDEGSRQKVLEELVERLGRLRGPDGQPVVRRFYKTADIFSGPQAKRLPDLFIEPEEEFVFTMPILKSGKTFYKPDPVFELHGCHELPGVYVFAGSQIQKGQGVDYNIMDMAPTILTLLEVPVPRAMDGKIMEGVFRTPPQLAFSDSSSAAALPTTPDEDEEIVRERLRALGYMD